MERILVTDTSFGDLEIEREILDELDCEVVEASGDLEDSVRDADYVLTHRRPITAPVIQAMERAKVIVRYGSSLDSIDCAAAKEANLAVCNVPDYAIEELADHTLALILSLARQVDPNARRARAGDHGLAVRPSTIRTLAELTVGLVGWGFVGRAVTERLRPFSCRVLVADPAVSFEEIEAAGAGAVELPYLFAESDVISLHCPGNEANHQLIDEDALFQTKIGVRLVNTSHGRLIDSAATYKRQKLQLAYKSCHQQQQLH
ncbi:MAG: NAD(P)-dependent oxidoreductase [Planctomycetota bacterium]